MGLFNFSLQSNPKDRLLWVLALTSLASLSALAYEKYQNKKRIKQKRTVIDLIGDTPLLYLPKLSETIGAQVYIKCECFNPFGSSKDRAVKHMVQQAEKKGAFGNQKQVIEASSGSTAISLVQISHIKGIKPSIFLPNDLAQDKYTYLETLGANIVKVPPVSIVDSKHFYNLASKYSADTGAFFMNQFQNLDNFQIHLQETGPEIYAQMNQEMSAFVCGAGTGGTIAGVSRYLKQKKEDIDIVLADPEGSGLFNKVKNGVLYTNQEKQGYRLKNPFDTVIQGIGLNRPTQNFNQAQIDDAFKIKDQEALHMAHYLIQNQGLFLGGSCALNLAAVVKYVRKNKQSQQKPLRVVTIVHDMGNRYLKKFYSSEYLRAKGITFEKKQFYSPNDLSFIS